MTESIPFETIPLDQLTEEKLLERLQWHAERGYSFCLNIPASNQNATAAMGLFQCQRCGWCCHNIGEIVVENSELKQVANCAGISHKEIKRRCTMNDDKHYLKSPCSFYQDGCSVYNGRPKMCRLYPLQQPQVIEGVSYLFVDPRCPGARKLVLDIVRIAKKS